MKLTFNKITLHNFLSYSHSELELKDLGYTVVSGINNHKVDGALSNGSGKSSIFNAICYALTGETAQGLKNNIENIYGDPNDCWVELDFNVDLDNFVVRRIKTPYSNMKIWHNGSDISGKGIKESTKILSDYIPDLTSMLLGSIIILGQGLPYRFTNNHPGGRKELLEKLTKSDFMIESIREKLDLRQAELKLQLRQHEDMLVSSNTQVDVYTKQLENYNKELEDYNDNVDDKLVTIRQNINKCLGLVGTLSNEKNALEKQLNSIDKDKNDHILSRNNLLKTKELDEISETIKKVTSFSTEDQIEIKSLEKEIKRLEKITDICPTCGQKIPNVTKIDTSDLKKKLEDRVEFNKFHNDQLKDLNNSYDELSKKLINEFELKLTELTDNYNDIRLKIKEVDSKITKNNSDYQTFLKEELKLSTLKESYNKLVSNIDEIKKQLSSLEEEIKNNNALILNDNEHLRVIQDLITLTKREFRGVLLENVINYMNKKVKQYSQKVFNNDLLSFTLNDNYIDIMFDNKYYEALSGGEKQKVDIIIQLALRDLLSSNLGLYANILVLDEIFDNLDSTGCQGVMNLISNMNDIESVFIISHHTSDLQISYDTEIIVEKGDDGISSIAIH